MKISNKLIAGGVGLALALTLAGCSVEQTREAQLPDVDVQADAGKIPGYKVVKTQDGEMPSVDADVKGGQMPEFDVDTAEVDVTTQEETVKIPKPKVVVEEETVEIPDVNVTMPDEK
ncbi:MAG: hypothetical protein WC314_17080 [Vulcanimicrobiota bacterium]